MYQNDMNPVGVGVGVIVEKMPPMMEDPGNCSVPVIVPAPPPIAVKTSADVKGQVLFDMDPKTLSLQEVRDQLFIF